MSHGDDEYARALAAALRHSTGWLHSLPGRPVGPAVPAQRHDPGSHGPDHRGRQGVVSGSRWRDRDILRVSVSNWHTAGDEVRTAVDAVSSALTAVRGS